MGGTIGGKGENKDLKGKIERGGGGVGRRKGGSTAVEEWVWRCKGGHQGQWGFKKKGGDGGGRVELGGNK